MARNLMSEDPLQSEEGRVPKTIRQRIIQELVGTLRSARQLAGLLGISEKNIEEHLPYVVKSLARDKTQSFVIDPATCLDCQFIFRNRTRLTIPSRCPKCRSEAITPPQFGIRSQSNSRR